MRQAPLILGIVLAGCLGGPEPDETESLYAATPGAPTPDELAYDRDQGRFILGSTPDKMWPNKPYYFRVLSQQNGFTLRVPSAGVRGQLGTHLIGNDGKDHASDDPFFKGKVLVAETNEQVRIRSTERIIAGGIISTLYYLDYLEVKPGSSQWVDYCGPEGGGALPLHGYYDRQRDHISSSLYVSFACRDSTPRKCNSWGYAPGNGGPGTDNWDFHQACTGMTSALYCGDGTPYTREKTPIRIRDAVPGYGDESTVALTHPISLPGDPETYYIESAWKRDGRPKCVAKFRWQALSPNQCGGALPDPRFNEVDDDDDGVVGFCDDFPQAQLLADPEIVLVVGSKMMDATLHRWRNPDTGDIVTTIRGFVIDQDKNCQLDSDSTPPFPLVMGKGYTQYLGVEGMILRNLPGSLSETQMSPVYIERGSDGHLSSNGSGRSDPDFEGYAFRLRETLTNTAIPGVISGSELHLCKRDGNHDNEVGALGDCDEGAPQLLGFALSPPLPLPPFPACP